MQSFDLDTVSQMQQLDPEHMLSHIDAMSQQLQDAWAAAQSYPLPDEYTQPRQIVLCGMGGSAIGGDLIAALVAGSAPVPFVVVRGYELPAYVSGPDTLVIASSNSGNTEETLAAAATARERGARVLAVTTGGKLAGFASEHGYPLWQFSYESQPRAALGWSFGLLVGLAHRLGLVPSLESDVDEALGLLRAQTDAYTASTPTVSNPAKQAALQIAGRLPVVIGSGIFEPVALRWKGQLNENAKVWAQFEPMPEMNHNAVASVIFPPEQGFDLAALFIMSETYDHPRVTLRYDLTYAMCEENGFAAQRFQPQGASKLAQMCHAIQFGDYLSYYAAMIYQKDPTAIAQILGLKARMAGR